MTQKNRIMKNQKIKVYQKKWRGQNKEKIKKYQTEYRIKNKEKISKVLKEYRRTNLNKLKKYYRKWRQENKNKIREYWGKQKSKTKRNIREKINRENPEFKIKSLLRIRLYHVFNKFIKTGKIMHAKGYGINYNLIIKHLKPFPKNRSDYHIHHIQPLGSFNFIKEDGSINLEEVQKAFAPENHQLMLAEEHNKLNHRTIAN